MNRKASGFLILKKGIEGFLHFKTTEGLSDRTLESYKSI
jgi:hypothetical protein